MTQSLRKDCVQSEHVAELTLSILTELQFILGCYLSSVLVVSYRPLLSFSQEVRMISSAV